MRIIHWICLNLAIPLLIFILENSLVEKRKPIIRWVCLYLGIPFLIIMGLGNRKRKSVIFVGQAYYNSWYLSRELRKIGWKADLYNWDVNPASQIFYHGQDYQLDSDETVCGWELWAFYLFALYKYDVFHFANKGGISFSQDFSNKLEKKTGEKALDIRFLKKLGKKIVYSNNGCLDGVSQTSFSRWGTEPVCKDCVWQSVPEVCNDKSNLEWGKFRNSVADFQCFLGGNRVDCNNFHTIHEVPEFFCLDPKIWHPNIIVPNKFIRNPMSTGGVRLYHAVGNMKLRTRNDGVNIKSTHIYLPLVERLRSRNYDIDLIIPKEVPNIDVRYLQVQADIVLDMLSFGWYGANAREAMMLGKPVICYIRPEWVKIIGEELPDFVKELPVISATKDTVEEVLVDLINDPKKRSEIGKKSREFSLKWHSSDVAAARFDSIYSELLRLTK